MNQPIWQPGPRVAARACASTCAACQADASPGAMAMTGAVLATEVSLQVRAVLSRVGLWLVPPRGVTSVQVRVAASPTAREVVGPTALRARSAATCGSEAVVWRGAALRATPEGWTGSVALPAPDARTAGLGDITRIELAGIAVRPGTETLEIRIVVPGHGCLHGVVHVTVHPSAGSTPQRVGAYAAMDGTNAEVARGLARWVDGAMTVANPAEVRLRVQYGARATVEHAFTHARWTAALRDLTRGRVAAVELSTARWCVLAATGTRARPEITELVAWAQAPCESFATAMITAAAGLEPGVLQAVVGSWDESVLPRAASAWEVARGVPVVPLERTWLSRYLRAPGAWARIGDLTLYGEAVRRGWPDREAWQRHTVPGGTGARSAAVRALWRRADGSRRSMEA